MSDYKESSVTGTSWQRCYSIVINNPYGAMPSIRFDEETCIAIFDKTVSEPAGSIIKKFDDPAKTFDLRDPTTGDLVGSTMTHGEVYAVLWSLYMSLAEERDLNPVE